MSDAQLRVIADLLEAIGGAHTARAMVRAVAASFATHLPLTRVELSAPSEHVTAELVRGEWRCVDDAPRARASIELAPGLSIALARRAALPAYFAGAGFRAALAQVLESAFRHLAVVQRVAELSRRAHATTRELRGDLDRLVDSPTLVSRSAAMRSVVERARQVAHHPTTALLTGESGVGKEVLAREIHRLSPRAHRPMLQINCGAIPDALVESELFGHERGAFTGAERRHQGVFERAHRSTLLLDEIAELPPAAQVKLLRVLQERQLRRVGGTEQIAVDVRLIAATNRPLSEMVRAGRFREDLYYRLDVFSIEVPPLRERKGDLGPLVAALVGSLAARLGIDAPPVTRAVLDRLEAHDWPGNVRELSNVLEAALIVGGGRAIALPASFAHARRSHLPAFNAAVRETIEVALRATRGKIYGADGAAARLGLKPGTLQSKMRKLGIERERFV